MKKEKDEMNNFKDIIGHENIIQNIKSSIRSNKISHAYIFEGEEGLGKKLIVNSFAKTLQCETLGDEPCDRCNSCKGFDSFNHPDIKYIIPTKKASLGVDDIREQLNNDIHIKPYRYKYKIYIILNGDIMTEQAQNALLKTIEEPPDYAIIIIIAKNSSRFLPTVLSRCILFSLKAINEEKVLDYLVNKEGISKDQARLYASISRGNIGRAMTFLSSEEFKDIREDIILAINSIIEKDEMKIIEISKGFNDYKDRYDLILELFLTWLRDLLLIKMVDNGDYIINKDKYKILLNQAQHLSYNRISILLDKIMDIQINRKVNVNYQLSMEILLFKDK